MPHRSNPEVSARIDHWWSIARDDILADPFVPMARAGLFQIGLPGADAALDGYRAIAAAEQALAAKTGLLGLASAFAARQMAARFFRGLCQSGAARNMAAAHCCWRVCTAIAISERAARTRSF
jgi:acyl-CoA dehydrogenase